MVWLVVGLGVLAFLQAFLYPSLYRRERTADPDPLTVDYPPGRQVRVLASDGDPVLILKTPLDLPEADLEDFRALDARLFPGGERHRYYVLVLRNDTEAEIVVDLGAERLTLEEEGGAVYEAVDLPSVVAARAASLPPYLLSQLSLWLAGDVELTLPPGSRRAVLHAFAEAADPERIARARFGDEVLLPLAFEKDRLDAALDAPDAWLRAKRP